MNWENYRKYSDHMSKVEKSLMERRLKEWVDGHGLGDEKANANWGTSETMLAAEMFEAGWVAHAIETGDDPMLKEVEKGG